MVIIIQILFLSISFLVNSCHYTFYGTSIHKDSKTLSIPTFINRSSFINPIIAQEFTIALQDRFIQRTKLMLVKDNNQADITILGEIISYDINSINSLSYRNRNNENYENDGDDNRFQNRLSMSIKIRYKSNQESEKNFDKVFSDHSDFIGKKNIIDNELIKSDVMTLLKKRLIDQIFNAIAVDW